jgi:hypothetical protein
MKALVDFMNWLTDMDWGWWPLLGARPSKDKPINSAVLLKITPYFGTATGLVIAIFEHHLTSLLRVAADVLVGWLVFFILYRFTFALAWNSRARLLGHSLAEPSASPNGGPTLPPGDSAATEGPPSVS